MHRHWSLPNGAHALLEVHHAAVRGIAAKDYPPAVIEAWAPMPVTKDAIGLVRANSGREFRLIAEIGGRVVGIGIGRLLMTEAERRARQLKLAGLSLTTFRMPPWNGPWFRRQGYSPIPEELVGPGLRTILDRHATFHDMATRETLWKSIALTNRR
jgi:GNAT superfamily N-acetyltransferase